MAPPGAAAEAPAAATEPFTAASLEREVERIAAAHGGGDTALWPGFDPLAVPLAVYDGARTTLFRHPSPPPEFRSLPGSAPPASVFEGRYGAMTANTSAEIG
ncbi:MAG: hypothetical protein QUU85_10120, partial [Candidatus Eisenbacteria bacterium]|nr:hypothetical protein [Candidatus Eisenbacteria bacterium]